MKVELHAHTLRHSACATQTPSELLAALIERGYEAVYFTEHDALWDEQDLDFLRREFPQIKIFPGVERSVERSHLVVLGAQDREYLELSTVADILLKASNDGFLTVLAHPFRWPDRDQPLHGGLLPDALEFRTCNHDEKAGARSLEAAVRLHLPLVNAGDVHAIKMMDQFWIETEQDLVQTEDIREIILQGRYRNCQKG